MPILEKCKTGKFFFIKPPLPASKPPLPCKKARLPDFEHGRRNTLGASEIPQRTGFVAM